MALKSHTLTKQIAGNVSPTGVGSADLGLHPIKTVEYMADGLESLEPNVFYVPHGTNQSAVDPFILVDGFLYIFQMTIQPIHAINHGLVDSANSYDFPPRSKWRFVFITPPNLVLVVPQPR